jgi:hypothetical protein
LDKRGKGAARFQRTGFGVFIATAESGSAQTMFFPFLGLYVPYCRVSKSCQSISRDVRSCVSVVSLSIKDVSNRLLRHHSSNPCTDMGAFDKNMLLEVLYPRHERGWPAQKENRLAGMSSPESAHFFHSYNVFQWRLTATSSTERRWHLLRPQSTLAVTLERHIQLRHRSSCLPLSQRTNHNGA